MRFTYGTITRYGHSFQSIRLCIDFVTESLHCNATPAAPQLPSKNACRLNFDEFGLFPFRSPLLREYLRFLFLRVLRCFTSPGIASSTYEFSAGSCGMTRMGLPHSEISGSKAVCASPKPIAAYHVLHRQLTPSHPPQTLRSLTLCLFQLRIAALLCLFANAGQFS